MQRLAYSKTSKFMAKLGTFCCIVPAGSTVCWLTDVLSIYMFCLEKETFQKKHLQPNPDCCPLAVWIHLNKKPSNYLFIIFVFRMLWLSGSPHTHRCSTIARWALWSVWKMHHSHWTILICWNIYTRGLYPRPQILGNMSCADRVTRKQIKSGDKFQGRIIFRFVYRLNDAQLKQLMLIFIVKAN